uniref:ribulose-1,5 bisphosphate carboxylase/oxygenase large subunit N-methyltransferase, chloroplastic isoform X2 n=1 Tax=Fragaria vesca subsp. vesca TaxID=101020 RepID=UPI0005C8FFEB|nr:PREDICTED: ribulose-1,5 bisphosphate carboxylase/oxygenase large subunit N-methyltransferase, chloroplastic isoform X2 [Fragaria vesca subsp. vesca]
MLLIARQFSHHWWRHRHRPHVSLSHAPLSQLNFHSESDDFLPWLQRKSGTEISSALSIGESTHGRALFASKTIRAGDCILKQLAPDNLAPELRDLIGDSVGDVAKVAVVILCEQKMGQGSEWAPYISRLPRLEEMHSTIFWSEDELEMIRQSSLYQETINQRSFVEKEYSAIRTVLECFPEMFQSITCKEFMHAYALVTSRAWGSKKGYSLIPVADFLNHDGTSESIVLSDDDKHFSEVIADRNYTQGEQVLIRYGKFSNATLLLDFGFTLPYNIHDQVRIQVNRPHHDALCDLKLELLKRHHRPINNDVNGFNSSVDCFTIKEVRSGSEKGKGIPHSLRAFARVLRCTSCEELSDLANEAAEHDGRLARRPLTNRSREIEAHQMLMEVLTQLAEDCDASIKSLGPVSSPAMCERLSLRTQMARDLLNGEIRILNSARAWLLHYCTTLIATNCHQ